MQTKITKKNNLKIIALDAGREFGESICSHLTKITNNYGIDKTIELVKIEEVRFSNGEIKVVINESIRGSDLYIVQLFDQRSPAYIDKQAGVNRNHNTNNFKNSINDNIIAMTTVINAAYHSDASRITAVIPQFPYARQDKRKGREPITAKLIGYFLEASGANRAITLDIHSETIQGFFNQLMLENLHMGRILIDYVKKNYTLENLMVVAPDIGSAQRNVFFAQNLKTELAIIHKTRDYSKPSTIATMDLVGNVVGKNILICDDMIDTGGTIISACKLLKKNGARDITIAAALPYLSRGIENFQNAYEQNLFNKLIGTNAVSWGLELKSQPWYHELDVSELFAQVIFNLNQGNSVSELMT